MSPAKKPAARKAAAKKTAAKKTTAKKAASKKTTAKRAVASRSTSSKPAPKKAVARKQTSRAAKPSAKSAAKPSLKKAAKTSAAKTTSKSSKSPQLPAASGKSTAKTPAKPAGSRTGAKTLADATVTLPPTRKPLIRKPTPKKPAARPPRPAKLDKATLAQIRAQLDSERIDLQRQIQELELNSFDSTQSDMTGEVGLDEDFADAGTATFDRERDLSIRNNIRDLIDQISQAIDRIDEGVYGTCARCGQPIDAARLKALPHASLCMDCKRREERAR